MISDYFCTNNDFPVGKQNYWQMEWRGQFIKISICIALQTVFSLYLKKNIRVL